MTIHPIMKALVLAIVLIIAFTFIINIASVRDAQAHDFWINNGEYKSLVDGSGCCGDSDCISFNESEVKVTPAGYALPSGEVVPFADAQAGEDEKYWRCKRYDGSRRCFFTPSGGV